MSSALICPMTGQEIINPMKLSCNHTFEKEAVIEYLRLNRMCPVCKKPYTESIPLPSMPLGNLANLKLKLLKKAKGLSMRSKQPKLTDPLLEKLTLSAETDGIYYNLCLTAPECEERRPVAITCIIDISGSMGTVVGKAEGSKGYTRLDLVKHVLNVLINSLNKDDYLSLIKFTDYTELSLDLCPMNDENKKIARDQVKDLRPTAGTTTGPAIKLAYEVASNGPQNYINSIILLTDGVDSNGEDALRQEYDNIFKHRNIQFNTFGFSSDIWSHLLQELAIKGDGLFGYIPDQTMIGTVFINYLANTLLTYDQCIYFSIDDNYELVYYNHPKKFSINYGQSRNFLLRKTRAHVDSPPTIKLWKNIANEIELKPSQLHENVDLSKQIARNKLIKFCFDSSLPRVAARTYEDSKDLNLPDFKTEFKQLDPTNPNQQQLKLSLTYWNTWGAHYVRSFVFAHLYELCLNFRAPSMQIYKTSKFDLISEELTDLFCSLDPPEPTGYIYCYDDDGSGNINMNSLMDPNGGCILETCKIKLQNGIWIPIGSLRKGDCLFNGSKVTCLIKTLYEKPLIKIGKLAITPYHPIFYNDNWMFPIDLILNKHDGVSLITPENSIYVCNLVLDKNHVIDVEGVNCVTLGHNFEGNVLKHPYFGTNAVINELSKFKGWNEGLIELNNCRYERDENGFIISTKINNN